MPTCYNSYNSQYPGNGPREVIFLKKKQIPALLIALALLFGLSAPAQAANPDDFTACYYQEARTGTNHEVLVVGWDDSYPAENFGCSSAGATPTADGAWLCRNSYGDSWGDGGYFWLSYYDASLMVTSGGKISAARATVFDFGSAGNYDNNYEYDGAAILSYVNDKIDGRGFSTEDADAGTRRWYANIFTASANNGGAEALTAVSTYTYRAGVPYILKIYTNVKSADDPTSGTLRRTQSGTFPYAGFHTVPLFSSVTVTEGTEFSVVFEVGMAANNSVFIPACSTSSTWYSTNSSQTGQSFVSMDGSSWYDCHTLTGKPNVRIKAYTDNIDDPDAPETDGAAETEAPETDGAAETEAPEDESPRPEETSAAPEATAPPMAVPEETACPDSESETTPETPEPSPAEAEETPQPVPESSDCGDNPEPSAEEESLPDGSEAPVETDFALSLDGAGDEAPAGEDLFSLGDASSSGHVSFDDEEVEVVPVPEPDEEFQLFSFRTSGVFSAATDGASSAYDPRTNGTLPPVRAQGSFNTCWAMSAMAAAEIAGRRQGLLTSSVNLSERHLIYFLSHQTNDPLGNSSDDYNTNPSFWIEKGGNPVLATMTMANWHGPADEAATSSPYAGLSAADTISSAYAYLDVLHLENTYALDIADTDSRNALKDLIRQHGSAVLCFWYDASSLFTGSPSEASATPTPTPTSTPEPTPTPTPAPFPFQDVARSAWYYSDVDASWRKGLVLGMSSVTYAPGRNATRAQVVTTLWRLAGSPAPETTASFPDTESGLWYSDAVAWASENGIVTGYTNGRFLPNNTITRQELMTVLFRYANYAGMNTSQTMSIARFSDNASVGSWAKGAVIWSVASGLQNGVATDSGVILDPNGNVTRAQLAAFLNRFSDMN